MTNTNLPVQLPVGRVLVHWRVVLERYFSKRSQTSIRGAPGHDEGPGRSGFSLQVAVHREALATAVVDPVDAAVSFSVSQVVQTGLGLKGLGCSLFTDGLRAAGTLKEERGITW